MNNIVLLLGGNLGNISENFSKAKQLVTEKIGNIYSHSLIYQSEAWGFEAKELFLNQVLQIRSTLNAFEVLECTQNIEKTIGRKNKTINQTYSSRLIDIDILFFNNDLISSPKLTVPHPKLHFRNFTLKPLNELIPNYKHPKLGKTINWLYKNSKDSNSCKIMDHEKAK